MIRHDPEVPGAHELRLMFGALLAGFVGSWVGLVWSASARMAIAGTPEECASSPPELTPDILDTGLVDTGAIALEADSASSAP